MTKLHIPEKTTSPPLGYSNSGTFGEGEQNYLSSLTDHLLFLSFFIYVFADFHFGDRGSRTDL
jgi:hypothetical protein